MLEHEGWSCRTRRLHFRPARDRKPGDDPGRRECETRRVNSRERRKHPSEEQTCGHLPPGDQPQNWRATGTAGTNPKTGQVPPQVLFNLDFGGRVPEVSSTRCPTACRRSVRRLRFLPVGGRGMMVCPSGLLAVVVRGTPWSAVLLVFTGCPPSPVSLWSLGTLSFSLSSPRWTGRSSCVAWVPAAILDPLLLGGHDVEDLFHEHLPGRDQIIVVTARSVTCRGLFSVAAQGPFHLEQDHVRNIAERGTPAVRLHAS